MTKIYEVDVDLGTFTCDVHCVQDAHGSLTTPIKVDVNFGKAIVNVLEFLNPETIEDIKIQIANAITEGSLEWRDTSR